MVIHVRNAETDRVVRELASKLGLSIPKAVRRAVENELREMNLAKVATKKTSAADTAPETITKSSDADRR